MSMLVSEGADASEVSFVVNRYDEEPTSRGRIAAASSSPLHWASCHDVKQTQSAPVTSHIR